jgi:hypothetical protein
MTTDTALALLRDAAGNLYMAYNAFTRNDAIAWEPLKETADRITALLQRKMEAENAELRNDAEIGSAIRMAAKDLPENFELEITVERGAASVYLRTPDEETVCIDVDSDNRLAAEIRNGIDRARSANERI